MLEGNCYGLRNCLPLGFAMQAPIESRSSGLMQSRRPAAAASAARHVSEPSGLMLRRICKVPGPAAWSSRKYLSSCFVGMHIIVAIVVAFALLLLL